MKKKNLIILLVFPFLIAVFCIVAVNTTYNKIDVDISYIDWKYNDMEAFQISESLYLLEAQGVNQRHYKVSGDGTLEWFVENKSTDGEEECAKIVEKSGKYYLQAIREGEVIITCSNKKGTVFRQMTGVIYKDAAILLYPIIGGSNTNIDSIVYYGEYDHRIGNPASIEMKLFVVPTSAAEEMQIDHTDNISFNKDTSMINITGVGRANMTISLPSGLARDRSFDFEIVDDGVNVYNYDDLLYCTNRSENGEIAVLRKSFESVDNTYVFGTDGKPLKSGDSYRTRVNNVECFGNYDAKTGKFSFSEEIYSFTTTYNKNYIDQWNEFVKTNSKYTSLTDQINVGLHVQKDFYGNGYTLNFHNLTYPYAYTLMTNDSGETVRIPQLSSDNLFRGPLKFYALGDPNNMPLVAFYGQDNIGMYVHGSNITVNDVNVKNCEFGDRLANLATVGTVMEIYGNNVTVKNSRISNGKNVVRSFSSMDLTLSNNMLSNSQNFLLVTGSNEYVAVDTSATATFTDDNGTKKAAPIDQFFAPGAEGDKITNKFLMNTFSTPDSKEKMRKALLSMQNALGSKQKIQGNFKGSTEVEDCYFYQSGIASICMETSFNSTFIESALPSEITGLLKEKELIPYVPTHVSGTSYPVKLNISGDTRFYDYKVAENIDLNGLIEENFSTVANSLDLTLDGKEVEINIDMIFPLKEMMLGRATAQNAIHINTEDGKKYVNVPVAFYGGGLNMCEVTSNGYKNESSLSAKVDVNLLDSCLNYRSSGSASTLKAFALKTVITGTGYEPFAFQFVSNGYLYGKTPKVTELIAKVKGE